MKVLLVLAAALPVVLSAGDAVAVSYSGNWPFTVSHSYNFDGDHCVALKDNGKAGWPHSGPAVIDGRLPGEFQIIGHTLMVSVTDQGFTQNANSVFSAAVGNGNFGSGAFSEVYNGPQINSGRLVFGMKGGC